MTDRAITDLAPDATHSRPKSRWEPAAERYAHALLPDAEALEAVELAAVCAEFEGSLDDQEVMRGAIRDSVASRLTDRLSTPAGGTHRECAGIPELLLARPREGVSDAEQAQLSEHLAWCDRCREVDRRIRLAELAFDAPPPAGRFERVPVPAPASAAPIGAAAPAAPEAPAQAVSIDPEFDASAPATTVGIHWTQDDIPRPPDDAPSRREPSSASGRVSRSLVAAIAAGLLVVSGIAVAAVLSSGTSDDSKPTRSVATPAQQPPPRLEVEPPNRPADGRATADRSAARERERAAERRRRQAERRRRQAERRERRRSRTAQPQSTAPTPAPVTPTTPAPQATPPAPRRNTPTPRRSPPPPARRPPATPSAPDNPVPSPPSDAPGRQPPS